MSLPQLGAHLEESRLEPSGRLRAPARDPQLRGTPSEAPGKQRRGPPLADRGLPIAPSRLRAVGRVLGLLLLLPAIGVLPSPDAHAGEAALEDAPPPEAANEIDGPIAKGFDEKARLPTFFPRLKRLLKDQPPFLRDARILLHLRSYWLERDPPGPIEREAAAYGGWLAAESGEWRDLLSLGATFYHVLAGHPPFQGQHGFSELGEAWARFRLGDHAALLYRQTLDLPYVNRQDSRMVPNTFEGYTLRGSRDAIAYVAGYLSDIKLRDSDRFVPMSEAAGVTTQDEGMVLAGRFPMRPRDVVYVSTNGLTKFSRIVDKIFPYLRGAAVIDDLIN